MTTPNHPLTPLKVLLVEDNADDVFIIQSLLDRISTMHFEVEWEPTYDQALEHLRNQKPDICFLDYHLGKKTGLDLLHAADQAGYQTPIIMLTGVTDSSIDRQTMKTGAWDYIVKGEATPNLLERTIRHTLERNEAQHEQSHITQQLIESSRHIGMAEVAKDVLHNVGNVLNSMNVSVGMLTRQIPELPLGDIQRIAKLLENHEQHLDEYLSDHKQGKHIPTFLKRLGSYLATQQQAMGEEIARLRAQVDQIKRIITAQQQFTGASSQPEPVFLRDLIDHVLLIQKPGLEKYHIHITREYGDIPQMHIDKPQLTDILMTLIRYAKESIRNHQNIQHRILIHTQWQPDQELPISIQVCHPGILSSPEEITRSFSQDFSPQDDDQPLQLHRSAIAAKNLGGTLMVTHYEGTQGIAFTLKLPRNETALSHVMELVS